MPDSLGATEREYSRDFPGSIARFRQGDRVVVIHRVERATRRFHFSRVCLEGLGWELEPGPLLVDDRGRRWSAWTARRDGRVMRVRQRIEDAAGRGFTDASSWFWAAALGRTRGPWTAWTVAEPAGPESAILEGS